MKAANENNGGWFFGCLTVESIKTLYRELAKKHHPDLGGDTATMQDINAAYLAALKGCDGQRSHDAENKEHTYRYNEETETAVMNKVMELVRAVPASVRVALIGCWIWIMGTTREDTTTRAALKAAGCMWHAKRSAWYWRPLEWRHRGRQSRGSLSHLAARYGCRVFDPQSETAAAMA
jgi:hypothetical protein